MGKDAQDGHATSDDLLSEHDAHVDLAVKTGLGMPLDPAEAEELTKEFDDNESADKAAAEAEKADPDDERNTP